jgi:SSS family solute:Na+ symporter
VNTASVWACFIFAVGLVCSNMVFGYIASPINAGAIAMVGGLILVPIVSLITPAPNKEKTALLFKESYKNLHEHPVDAE